MNMFMPNIRTLTSARPQQNTPIKVEAANIRHNVRPHLCELYFRCFNVDWSDRSSETVVWVIIKVCRNLGIDVAMANSTCHKSRKKGEAPATHL